MSETKVFEVLVEDAESEYGEQRQILRVVRDGKAVREHYDRGEAEDNSFYRDWRWVPDAIKQAYEFGLEDGRRTTHDSTGDEQEKKGQGA